MKWIHAGKPFTSDQHQQLFFIRHEIHHQIRKYLSQAGSLLYTFEECGPDESIEEESKQQIHHCNTVVRETAGDLLRAAYWLGQTLGRDEYKKICDEHNYDGYAMKFLPYNS